METHGGGYPSTFDRRGTLSDDGCMSVATLEQGIVANGFNQNGFGFDAPGDETGWPNQSVVIAPHVAVWLR